MAEDRLLDSAETAEFLGVPVSLLGEWRYRSEGPPYLKLGHRTVRYSTHDLARWLGERRVEAAS